MLEPVSFLKTASFHTYITVIIKEEQERCKYKAGNGGKRVVEREREKMSGE